MERSSCSDVLFGIFPAINARGPDITRSTADRVNIESLWLTSALSIVGVEWTSFERNQFHARFSAHTEIVELDYVIGESGELKAVHMQRWGNPD
jgi:hypothetical protein